MAVCPNCEGFGHKEEASLTESKLIPCPTCRATKEVDPPWDEATECPDCKGLGFVRDVSFKGGNIVGRTRCKKCDGRGVVLPEHLDKFRS